MSNLLMKNVREKFTKAREKCPGMSEEIYAVTDYLATIANDTLAPAGVVVMLISVIDDLDKKRCGFGIQIEFPEYLAIHAPQVRAQLPYILQVFDAIFDEAFAKEVREECQEAFHWGVPRRVVATDKVSTSDYINAAVDWWAEAIQHPRMNRGGNQSAFLMPTLGGKSRQYTENEINQFRKVLADVLAKELERRERVVLSVNYRPDCFLSQAGNIIGMNQFDYPCKTDMWISATKVSVCAGEGASEEIIWSAKS